MRLRPFLHSILLKSFTWHWRDTAELPSLFKEGIQGCWGVFISRVGKMGSEGVWVRADVQSGAHPYASLSEGNFPSPLAGEGRVSGPGEGCCPTKNRASNPH